MGKQRIYPVGIQDFEKLRQKGAIYVDKTDLVYQLVQKDYVFLSRPRRFGKSLLSSTLKYYFQGRKDLFQGLAIEELEQEWVQYPVLHFDLSMAKNQNLSLNPTKINGVCGRLLCCLKYENDNYTEFKKVDGNYPYRSKIRVDSGEMYLLTVKSDNGDRQKVSLESGSICEIYRGVQLVDGKTCAYSQYIVNTNSGENILRVRLDDDNCSLQIQKIAIYSMDEYFQDPEMIEGPGAE